MLCVFLRETTREWCRSFLLLLFFTSAVWGFDCFFLAFACLLGSKERGGQEGREGGRDVRI